MSQCIQCSKEFEAKRADAKYCSGACRMRSLRVTDNVTDNDLPVIKSDDVTDNSVTVNCNDTSCDDECKDFRTTISDEKGFYTGHCGHQSKLPICICAPCVMSGVSHESMGLKMCEPTKCGPGSACRCHGVYHPVTNTFHPFIPNKVFHAKCDGEVHRCKKYDSVNSEAFA